MNPRKITDEELADISNNWENPTVDIKKYYQNVFVAWEVNEKDYNPHKLNGGLCQKFNNRFYIA
jgi:hypothetical protein